MDFQKFLKENQEKLKCNAEKVAIYNKNGECVLCKNDEWREDKVWDNYLLDERGENN